MSATNTPNMNLILPTVGNQPGPDFADNINASLSIIDQHDHTNGSGVPITPSAMNINASLTFQNNFATAVAGITLQAQGSTPALNTIYESGTDLYFYDGSGNNVRITQSGGVAGSPGSISNLSSPASASYVSGSQTFVWQSGSSIAANMDAGSILMRNLTPNSTYALTLQPPAALGANYTITLPSAPAATSFLTMTSGGAMSGSIAVTGGLTTTNLSASAGILGSQLANLTVDTAQIANKSVTVGKQADMPTGATVVAGGVAVSLSSGSFNMTGTAETNVTNFSITITTTGRPVRVFLQPDGVNSGGIVTSIPIVGVQNVVSGSPQGYLYFKRDSTYVSTENIGTTNVNTTLVKAPASSFEHLDSVLAAGTYTYTVYVRGGSANDQVFVTNTRLLAYEI